MPTSAGEKPDPVDRANVDLRYPIGQYSPPSIIGRPEREAWIAELENLPRNLCNAVDAMSDDQLDTPYRPGGWTVR